MLYFWETLKNKNVLQKEKEEKVKEFLEIIGTIIRVILILIIVPIIPLSWPLLFVLWIAISIAVGYGPAIINGVFTLLCSQDPILILSAIGISIGGGIIYLLMILSPISLIGYLAYWLLEN